MALTPSTRLGVYEVIAQIGEGGMGQVYRARDLTLHRDVALKVLPDAFASDPDRLARFRREAQVLAALNHPNIAAIYGFEESTSVHALVLELVEGPTLADRIAQGPVPLDDALPIARQIAEALEAAHEQGLIHRDLKPANIKVRSDGTVKVLDFGLAKALAPPDPAHMHASQSPTITSPALLTGAGMILGTAAYMSPEQARGKLVDKRTDIWAFGCVVFEMLTGLRAFPGEDVTDTLAAVVRAEPSWDALPAQTPSGLRRLLTRCFKKDPRARMRDIGDARSQLEELISGAPEERSVTGISIATSRWQRALPWAATGALAVGLAAVLVLWAPWRTPSSPGPLRLSADLGADVSLRTGQRAAHLTLSPDGRTLVFSAQKADGTFDLYVRRLDALEAVRLAGTSGAGTPVFSPDGQWVAFLADGRLKKISVTGGAAITVVDDATSFDGISWSEDGTTIAFSPQRGSGLARVSSAGGTPEPLTALGDGQVTHRWPQMLPGGKAVLFTAHTRLGGFDDASLEVQPLPTGARKVVQRGAFYGRYLPSGHLVYIRAGTLFAAPFDVDRLVMTGPPVSVLEGVVANTGSGAASFAVSANGTLVYLPGRDVGTDVPVEWMDRDGKVTPLRTLPADWSNLVFAPDSRRLALDIFDGSQTHVWVYEWERDSLSRLTLGPGGAQRPVWTPDGRRIVFSSPRSDTATGNLYWQRADNTGELQRLTDSKSGQGAWSWHPNGRFLAFHELNPQMQDDVLILPMEGDEVSGWKPGTPFVFLNGPFAERAPMFSPDGRWLAYQSTESGRDEVYVRPFPGPGSRWTVSTDGGTTPTWSRTSNELFFAAVDRRLMVAAYAVDGDVFRPEKPRLWAEGRFVARPRQGPTRSFDLHPDGKRFALARQSQSDGEEKQDRISFFFNFFDELRRLAPAAAP